jgi:DNA-binding transcriptional LysR family regulator
VECLPDTPPSPTSVYVLYPRSRQLSLRVRVFIDWVAKEYASGQSNESRPWQAPSRPRKSRHV